jgi:hypothetical protein
VKYAALAVLLAGCDARAQAADPVPLPVAVPVLLPADWRPIAVASDAGQAAALIGNKDRRVTVRTWGETGLGCFVTVVEVDGVRVEPIARVASELQITLGTMLSVEQWQFVDGPTAEVSADVARGAMRGRLRGKLIADPTGVPHAAVAACFYNEREPPRCQAACTELLATLEAPRVTP